MKWDNINVVLDEGLSFSCKLSSYGYFLVSLYFKVAGLWKYLGHKAKAI